MITYGQPGLFDAPPPIVSIAEPAYDYEIEAEAFRSLGGAFANDQIGIVTLDFGEGITRRFRFIYNPNNYAVGRWGGPRVELFGPFGYRSMKDAVSPPESGQSFDEWILALLDSVKVYLAGRFASKDFAVFTQSANRSGLTAKQIKQIVNGDDFGRATVRENDLTPVEITEITFEPTNYRSHYEIQDMDLYFGRDLVEVSEEN